MITCICGGPGSGKTSYLAYLAVQKMLNSRADYLACKREFFVLNKTGFELSLPEQKHLCFSDIPIHFGRFKTYNIDGFKIGLPNPFFETTFLPSYATVFLDEAQRYYDSRMSRYLRDDVYRFYQLHRHNDYTFYLACQRLGNLDLNIRAIADKFLVMDKTGIKKNDYGQIDSITWFFHEFTSCDVAECYQLAKDKEEFLKIGKVVKETWNFDISYCYDTKSNRPVFFQNLFNGQKIDYFTEEGYHFSLDSFLEFNNTHFFTAPLGFWKNAERDKNILKKLGVSYAD